MRDRWTYLLLLPAIACGTPEEQAAERALHEGAESYRAEQYAEAADHYAKATHDPRVTYDLGNALYRMSLLDTAIVAYSAAIERSTEPTEQAVAYHNLGNAWSLMADRADSASKELDERVKGMKIEGDAIAAKVRQIVLRDSLVAAQRASEQLVDSALAQGSDAYKGALRRVPTDEETRLNLALVQRRIAARVEEKSNGPNDQNDEKKNEGLSEKAKMLMQQADEMVERYEFTKALNLLRDALKTDPTLQQRQDYMNKLDVVTKAAAAQ
jgi:tetratricopeptide (TPR) repeat protein